MGRMGDMMRDAIYQAYTGESKAALRLKAYAEQAEAEGYSQLAKLFRVISFSEEIHGKRALKLLQVIKHTEENLKASFESEIRVAEVAYNEFIQQADAIGDLPASLYFSQSRDVEEGHSKLYKEAMEHVMEERETTYYVCSICGYVSDGIFPDECPVCTAKKGNFLKFT
jgi:rubrerythrin